MDFLLHQWWVAQFIGCICERGNMDKSDTIPFYGIAIDADDFDNEVMKLFNELRPEWKKEDIVSKVSWHTMYQRNHLHIHS